MRLKTLLILVIPLLGLIVPYTVSAQGQSLSIYPPVIEVQTTPPSSPTVPIVIQNNNSEDITLRIELIPFKQRGLTGAIQLQPGLINQGFYPYYKERIQFLVNDLKTDTVTLSALETREVVLNINLQQGDPPGDYYYSIIFISSGERPDETSVSQLPAGIATNLLLSIGPKVPAQGGIAEFTTSSFKAAGPVDFNLKVHNAGKHLIAPTGTVDIYNMFGQKVGVVKVLSQYILSGSDRLMIDDKQSSSSASLKSNETLDTPTVIWPEKFLLGWYKAEANIKLEENGNKLKATTYFVAFPIYLFFPLFIAIFIGLSIYLKVKKKI